MSHASLLRISLSVLTLGLSVGGSLACRGQLAPQLSGLSPSAATPSSEPHPTGAPPAVAEQIRRGKVLYAQTCAQCHGASGEGTAGAPPVIGAEALPVSPPRGSRLRTGPFRVAKDVGMFIMTKMPPDGPRVPPTNVAAVLAYLLDQNGAAPTQAVSPSTAGSMPIHR